MMVSKNMVAGLAIVCAGVCAMAADDYGVHPDVTVASKYMAHGFNVNGEHGSLQPSVTVDTKVPVLQFFVWAALPMDQEIRASNEFDYLVKYGHTFATESALAVNLHGYVDYWDYPNKDDMSGWKFSGGVTLPKLLPLGPANLVPSYTYYYWTPQNSGAFEAGGVHEIFLSYAAPLLPKQSLDLGASLNYHDGVFGVKPGWSHATAGVSTTFDVGVKLTPAINYQWSFEDTVDTEDEVWATLSVSKDF